MIERIRCLFSIGNIFGIGLIDAIEPLLDEASECEICVGQCCCCVFQAFGNEESSNIVTLYKRVT